MINTEKHLCYVLKVFPSDLEEVISNSDNYYYEREIIKQNENGKIKKRVLNPSIGKLKSIQQKILQNILSKLILPDYAYGATFNRDNISNAKKHQGKKFKFKTDLKSFFPSINSKKVFEMFRSRDFSPTVARLLTQLTTYKNRLPQGAPTSPTIANLVFVKTGEKLFEFSKLHQITFTSFIDDLTFSSGRDFKKHTQSLLKIVKDSGFKISHTKTQYATKDVIITGLNPKQNFLDVSPEFKIKLCSLENKTDKQIVGITQYYKRVKATNL